MVTVIAANFRIPYCRFTIGHERRKIIHFNSTEHPTGEWIAQQLREAFQEPTDNQYVIFDHDAKFGAAVLDFLDTFGISRVRMSYRSPHSWLRLIALGEQLRSNFAWVGFTIAITGQKSLERCTRIHSDSPQASALGRCSALIEAFAAEFRAERQNKKAAMKRGYARALTSTESRTAPK